MRHSASFTNTIDGPGQSNPSLVISTPSPRCEIAAGHVNKALVIGAEMLTPMVDWTDRTTCVLFGDGAGASNSTGYSNNDNTTYVVSDS